MMSSLGFPSAMTTAGGWATRDGCQVGPTRVWADGGVHEDRWSGCRDGAEVRLITVEGGAHDWFGGNEHWDAGSPFNTSRAFVDFFQAHPRPPAMPATGS